MPTYPLELRCIKPLKPSKPHLDKYLKSYAEALPYATVAEKIAPCAHCLVIPVHKETVDFLQRLPGVTQRLLLIVVVNHQMDASEQVKVANLAFLQDVAGLFNLSTVCDRTGVMIGTPTTDSRISPSVELVLINRTREHLQLPNKQGVGLARKLGADMAAGLYVSGALSSPWICNTDADTKLPEQYFEAVDSFDDSFTALLFPFTHIDCGDAAVDLATMRYELFIRLYEEGLAWARSPYAFQTVGSAFAVHVQAYAQVRGFPKRQAAEDFYMLNKLAKVGPFAHARCAPIEIRSRTSDRVPFGTGAAVNKALRTADVQATKSSQYVQDYYDPRVFDQLQTVISIIPDLFDDPGQIRKTLLNHKSDVELDLITGGLEKIGMLTALDHAKANSTNVDQFIRHVHAWFDALRTRQFVHFLRDQRFPNLSLTELLNQSKYAKRIANWEFVESLQRRISVASQ